MKVRVNYENRSGDTYRNVDSFHINTQSSKAILRFGEDEIELNSVKNIHTYDEH